uniref:G-protein coupled receptors family 1 profile domain-containing protein n=1 Tax=Sphenodon punctatus TaxID=8508 RepID=A0A8D0L838_SPHPU
MGQENLTTTVTEFVLLGLTDNVTLKHLLFVLFSMVYLVTWLSNLTIITTVIYDHQLHTPMYFLLANLAFLDVSDSSVNSPKVLSTLLTRNKTISFKECIIQMLFFHFTAGVMGFSLVAMAIDRYVAIHKPLHYLTIMNQGMCTGLVIGAWLGGFTHSIIQIAVIVKLPFCGPNVLDNFYCDVPQVIKLACTDTYLVEWLMVVNGGFLIIIAFIALLISYTLILVKIRRHSTEGKHKALSTCGGKLTVVFLMFIPSIFIYARPFGKFPVDKMASVIYTIFTPMLNPMIYTLRNSEMKKSIRRLMNRILFSGHKSIMPAPGLGGQ